MAQNVDVARLNAAPAGWFRLGTRNKGDVPVPAAATSPIANPTREAELAGSTTSLDATGEASIVTTREWIVPGAEDVFRTVYTRSGADTCNVLAISSAISGEGKTTVGVGLAVTIAQDFPERRVVLVETDLRHPVLAADFGVDAAPGLIDCLEHDRPLSCRATEFENLHLLPAGGPSTSQARWLRSSRMVAAIDALRQTYDVVILDVPAVLVNSDALLLTDLADGVIFVVRSGVTPAALVTKAIGQLGEMKLRGVVLNGTKPATPGWIRRLLGL